MRFLKKLFGASAPAVPEPAIAVPAAVDSITPAAPEPSTVIATATQPIAVNLSGDAKVAHARYRMGAIARHVEQAAAEGRTVSEQRLKEFEIEMLLLKHTLLSAGEKI